MNPIQKNGVHFKDFLSSKETWESYLTRMERNSTWGDHLTLQALSEVTRNTIVVLNLSQEDIRRTEIVPSDPDKSHASLFLGHIGEYHYLSLRPKNWGRIWPGRKIFAIILRDKFYEECLHLYFTITGLHLVPIHAPTFDLVEVSQI